MSPERQALSRPDLPCTVEAERPACGARLPSNESFWAGARRTIAPAASWNEPACLQPAEPWLSPGDRPAPCQSGCAT